MYYAKNAYNAGLLLTNFQAHALAEALFFSGDRPWPSTGFTKCGFPAFTGATVPTLFRYKPEYLLHVAGRYVTTDWVTETALRNAETKLRAVLAGGTSDIELYP